jgi:RNA polymerase sigma-70 factor (sigma-E family)
MKTIAVEGSRVPRKDDQYTAFVAESWSRLFRTAYALTGDYREAEDLLQTALLKVYAAWHRVDTADAPDAYVRRILVNQVISWRRRPRHHAEILSDAPPEQAVESHEAVVAESRTMWDALRGLPPRQRTVVVLRFYEDLSERDIADLMKVSPGTVKSQCSAALAKLRAALGSDIVDGAGDAR